MKQTEFITPEPPPSDQELLDGSYEFWLQPSVRLIRS